MGTPNDGANLNLLTSSVRECDPVLFAHFLQNRHAVFLLVHDS